MRKRLLWLLILLLPLPALGESVIVDAPSDVFHLIGWGGSVYFCPYQGEGVYCLEAGAEEPALVYAIERNGKEYMPLAARADGVWGLERSKEQLIPLAGDCVEAAPIPVPVTRDGAGGKKNWHCGNTAFFHGDDYYFVINYTDSGRETLCRFDLRTGKLERMSLPGDFWDLCLPYGEDALLIGRQLENDSAEVTLFALDWKTQKQRKVAVLPEGCGCIAYNAAEDTLCYTVGSRLIRRSGISGMDEELLVLSIEPFGRYSALLDGNRIAVSDGELIQVISLHPQERSKCLTLVGVDTGNAAFRAFVQENQDMALDIRDNWQFTSAQQLAQELLLGTLDFDVMALRTSQYDLDILIEKGYCADLTQDERIAAGIKEMYPWAQAACRRGDALYAVPSQVGLQGWDAVCRNNWESAGLTEAELPVTFDEFLDFVGEFPDSGAGEARVIYPERDGKAWMLRMLMRRYIARYEKQGERVIFDTPLFRQLLAKTAQASRKLKMGQMAPALFEETSGDFWMNDFLALPLSQDAIAYPAAVTVYIVNPRSPRIKEALDYVACVLENLEPADERCLYPDATEAVENPYFAKEYAAFQAKLKELTQSMERAKTEKEKISYQAQLDQLNVRRSEEYWERRRYAITAEEVANYHAFVGPYLYVQGPSLMDETTENGRAICQTLRRYLDGNLDDERLIAELDQKLRLMRLEGD